MRLSGFFIFSFCVIWFCTPAGAQNEPFHGGIADGAADSASAAVYPPVVYEYLYIGGIASGFASAASGIVSPPVFYTELYTGGAADGFGSGASGSVAPPPVFLETYRGGTADGFTQSASGVLSPPQVFPDPYNGGMADGFSTAASAPVFPPNPGQDVYRGGPADGFAGGASGALSPPVLYTDLFAGGQADGFAFIASGPLTLPPTWSELYAGGGGDGFAYIPSDTLSPPPTYPQAYGGGLADGADRAQGSIPVPNDMAMEAILSPNGEVPFAAGNQPVSVVLANQGIDTITSAELHWSVNNVSQPPAAWTGLLPPGRRDTAVIGNYTFSVGISHDIVAWSFQPNGIPDPLWYNDTAKAAGLYAALNGTYTLGGASPDFPSFQAAATALNKGGVLGPVHLLVRNGVYNEQITLQEIRGASASNTVFFQSESADSSAVTLTYAPTSQANYVVRLDGADWVSFESLRFRTPNQPYSTAILFQNDATHNALRNNWIVSDGRQSRLVESPGAYTSILFNRLENGSQGVGFQTPPSLPVPGLIVEGNQFLQQSTIGLLLLSADSPVISGNFISTNVATLDYQAIRLQSCSNGISVAKNAIAVNAGHGIVLQSSSGSAANRARVANNMVSITGGSNATSGLYLNGNYTDIWYNSSRHAGSHSGSAAFFSEGGNNNEIKNNIFAHAGAGFAIVANAPDNIAVSDYNDIYPGQNAVLGRWMGVPIATLGAWQAATGRDMHSLSVDPLFSSVSDLHISQASLDGAASPMTAVTDDIDAQPRNSLTPDIGADEIGALPDDVGVSALLNPVSGCALNPADTIRVRIQNFGSAPLSGFDVAYRLGAGAPVVQAYTGPPIPAGATADMAFTATVDLSAPGSFAFRAYTVLADDSHPANDTVINTVTQTPAPAVPSNLLPLDNIQQMPVTPIFSWQPASNASAYALRIWPDAQPEPALPTVDNLTQISYLLSPPLTYGTGYNWRLTAKNAWCSTAGPFQHFTTLYLPDLAAENASTPPMPFNGQQIAVQWNTRNLGAGAAQGSWGESVFLSEDALVGNDIMLGSAGNFGALNPNESYANSVNATLPFTAFGNYYLLIVLDTWNNLAESNEGNNVTALPISINLTPPPDLEVVSAGPPPLGVFPSGQPLRIRWTVRNTGLGPTVSGGWNDRVYYSTNPVFSPNTAVHIGDKHHTGNLVVNADYTDSLDWAVPNGFSGTWYVYVTTDIGNSEFEHAFESNNTTRSNSFSLFVPGTPDLKVASVVPPLMGGNKQAVSIQWTVKNDGLATATPDWRDRVYISLNPAETNLNNAIYLGEKTVQQTLAPGDSIVLTMNVTLPDGINGSYYAYVFTDANDAVYEYAAANANNTGRSAGVMQVVSPDLVVQSIVAPDTAQAGDDILVYWTLKNQSTSAPLLNGIWTDRLSISPSVAPNLGIVTELATAPVSAATTLLPAGTLLRQTTVKIPAGISGQRYLHLTADCFNSVYEHSGENNNQPAAGTPVYISPAPYPDLRPVTVTPGANAAAGATLTFTFSVNNTGAGVAQGAAWQDRIYLQNSATFNAAQALLLSSFQVIQTLDPGGGYSTSGSAVLPATLAPGTYYLFVQTDVENVIFESTAEANNVLGSTGFPVAGYPPVDLAAQGVNTPDTAVAGQPFTMQFTIKNLAGVATPQNAWNDGIFLSADSLFSAGSDVLLGTSPRTQALAANGSYSAILSVTLPVSTTAGRYWVFAIADYQYLNTDANPANNAGVRRNGGVALPVYVQAAPPPDLQVYTLAAPAAANAGQPFQVVYTVANQGAGPTVSGGWNDVFFLSDDFLLNPGDLLLGSVAHSGNLAAGATYTDTVELTVPIQVSGNRILLLVTDYNNTVNEYLSENNNLASASLLISQPQPADLVVRNVAGPAMAIAGKTAGFSWSTVNEGLNIAQGYRRDALYLSTDTVWQATDPLLGYLDLSSSLPPQNADPRSLSVALNGVATGTYYALVRTDILNNILESNDANNTGVSAQPIVVAVPLLPYDTLISDTLVNFSNLYYRIEVTPDQAGETMLVTLDGLPQGLNELYLSKGTIPTRAAHDFRFSAPFSADQEILLPALDSGTYYLLAYGSTSQGSYQTVGLRAEIVQFQVLSVQANQGGNTGSMTLKVRGAKFSSGMTLRLAGSTDTITAHAVYFSDATQVFASFNLAGAALGFYDVVAEKPGGETAVLYDGFEVIAGSVTGGSSGGNGGFYCQIENIGAGSLTSVSVQHPPSTRPNRLVPIIINFGNNGNVDIPAPIRFIISLGGAPLAFDPDDLPANAQELLLKFDEPGGPPGVLRPGVTGTISLVTLAIAPLQFSITGN